MSAGTPQRVTSEDDRRHAVVTGGSSGIGAAIVTDLAEAGHRVDFCARGEDGIRRLEKQLRDRGLDATGHCCDVTDEPAVRTFVADAVADRGPVDVLINAAGTSGGGELGDLATETWDHVLDANLRSVFLVSREVLRSGGMKGQPRGRIVSIASTAGKQGIALATPYCASKHAVVGFTKALGLELAKSSITVNAVCPGYVDTPMAQVVLSNYAGAWQTTPEAVRERFEAKIPSGRYSTADEVAGMVGYLLTPAADIVTAQAMNVCGGLGNF